MKLLILGLALVFLTVGQLDGKRHRHKKSWSHVVKKAENDFDDLIKEINEETDEDLQYDRSFIADDFYDDGLKVEKETPRRLKKYGEYIADNFYDSGDFVLEDENDVQDILDYLFDSITDIAKHFHLGGRLLQKYYAELNRSLNTSTNSSNSSSSSNRTEVAAMVNVTLTNSSESTNRTRLMKEVKAAEATMSSKVNETLVSGIKNISKEIKAGNLSIGANITVVLPASNNTDALKVFETKIDNALKELFNATKSSSFPGNAVQIADKLLNTTSSLEMDIPRKNQNEIKAYLEGLEKEGKKLEKYPKGAKAELKNLYNMVLKFGKQFGVDKSEVDSFLGIKSRR